MRGIEVFYNHLIERDGGYIDDTAEDEPEFFALVKSALVQWKLDQLAKPVRLGFTITGRQHLGAFTVDSGFVANLMQVLADHHGIEMEEWRFNLVEDEQTFGGRFPHE